MLPLRDLFEFIQSLSKTEKRYIAVEIGAGEAPGNKFLSLYQRLTTFSNLGPEEERILRTEFTHNQLEIARKHLSKRLLKAMGVYHLQRDPETILWEKYQAARVLLLKGYNTSAIRHIQQGKRVANETGLTYFFSIFSQLELELGVEQKFADWEENHLVSLHDTMRALSEDKENERSHAALYELLLCRYWKNGIAQTHLQRAQLNDIVLEEHQLVSYQQKETFDSAQLHLHFQSVYFMMTGDVEGSLKTFYSLDELFQDNETEWVSAPKRYIRFLQDVLDTLRHFSRYDEMTYFLSRLANLTIVSPALKTQVSVFLSETKLHMSLAVDEHLDKSLMTPAFFFSGGHTSAQNMVRWWFTLARAHFTLKEYSAALGLINRILDIPAKVLGKMNYAKTRILLLMVHHEMQNRDVLHYELRSFERKMKNTDNWHQTEKLVTEYLKNWLAYKPFDVVRAHDALSLNEPYDHVMISELGLRKWLIA